MINAFDGSLPTSIVGEYFSRYGIVGKSRGIADVVDRIELVSATRSTVLSPARPALARNWSQARCIGAAPNARHRSSR
ncbi:MAG: hypothetical protein ABJA98_09460 [Acidobacteriota bacterium]